MAGALCRRFSRRVPGIGRCFSAAGPPGWDEPYIAVSSHSSAGSSTVWPDESMGPFGPQDQRFQLPGNVGFDWQLGPGAARRARHRALPDILTAPSSSQRHQFVLTQCLTQQQNGEVRAAPERIDSVESYFRSADVECSVCSCPELLTPELECVFPALSSSSITVITVTQRNPETQETEQELLDNFINGAKEICFLLWRNGYWADFIEPVSGRAFFGAPSHSEPKRRHSGFLIKDVASCRVIGQLGRRQGTLLGTMVTDAPLESVVVEQLRGRAPQTEKSD